MKQESNRRGAQREQSREKERKKMQENTRINFIFGGNDVVDDDDAARG